MNIKENSAFRHIIGLVLITFIFNLMVPYAYLPHGMHLASSPPTMDSAWSRLLHRVIDFVIPPASAQLVSTPEFDLNDPYLIEKASELGNDPQRIFEFVRDEIDFEVYEGSLRGARGTLWSGAGNALNQASLLIGLLRVAGVPARYVEGSLTPARQTDLLAGMFPQPLRVLGCPNPDSERADPVNDPALRAELADHFWVEYGSGGNLTQLNPSFMRGKHIQGHRPTNEHPLKTNNPTIPPLEYRAETTGIFFWTCNVITEKNQYF